MVWQQQHLQCGNSVVLRFCDRIIFSFDTMDWLQHQTQHFPQFAHLFQSLSELYSKKLWHQLTVKVEELLSNAEFTSNSVAMESMYEDFLNTLHFKINPLKHAQFVYIIGSKHPAEHCRAVLEKHLAKVSEGQDEARIYIQSKLVEQLLLLNEDRTAKDMLAQAEAGLNALHMADSLVHSAFYSAALHYYKKLGPATEFYRNAITYTEYTPLENMSPDEQQRLCKDMAFAALLSNELFNFGELLQNKIIKSLEQAGLDWIVEVLRSFSAGNISRYEELKQVYHREFASNTDISSTSSLAVLNEKIRLMALLNMVFARAAAERVLSFASIGSTCNVPSHEVELLVMRALSLGLVKGIIDEVKQQFTVTWVQPRVLDSTQIQELTHRLVNWSQQVKEVHSIMEGEAGELLR